MNANEIIRFDKNGDITKEWKEFVENLSREDLERFFIGADALCRRRKETFDEAMEYIDKLKDLPVLPMKYLKAVEDILKKAE